MQSTQKCGVWVEVRDFQRLVAVTLQRLHCSGLPLGEHSSEKFDEQEREPGQREGLHTVCMCARMRMGHMYMGYSLPSHVHSQQSFNQKFHAIYMI